MSDSRSQLRGLIRAILYLPSCGLVPKLGTVLLEQPYIRSSLRGAVQQTIADSLCRHLRSILDARRC